MTPKQSEYVRHRAAGLGQERAAGLRASYAVRVRGGDPLLLTIEDGALRVGDAGPPVDCRIGEHPAALLVVLWGRVPAWRAIAAGRLGAWGRRPWLAARLPQVPRNP